MVKPIGYSCLCIALSAGPRAPLIGVIARRQASRAHGAASLVEWGVDPTRLGMLGFSAGGHLALATALSADAREEPTDAIDDEDSRPNFLVPLYAVTNGDARGRKADEYWPTDILVDDKTPPTFIMHTHEDSVVPASQATLLYNALLTAGVPAELHIFNHGDHGLGLNRGSNPVDSKASPWGNLLLSWLRQHGFLHDQRSDGTPCALQGQVLLDGGPIGLGWLSFVPQRRQSPTVTVRLTGANAGRFHLDAADGPVPGPYRMVLHMVSERYPADSSGDFSLEHALYFEGSVDITPDTPVQWRLKAIRWDASLGTAPTASESGIALAEKKMSLPAV